MSVHTHYFLLSLSASTSSISAAAYNLTIGAVAVDVKTPFGTSITHGAKPASLLRGEEAEVSQPPSPSVPPCGPAPRGPLLAASLHQYNRASIKRNDFDMLVLS